MTDVKNDKLLSEFSSAYPRLKVGLSSAEDQVEWNCELGIKN